MQVKYLKNVNEDFLPASVKNEFNNIKDKFILSEYYPTILPEFEIIEILQRKDSLYQYNDDKDFDGDDFDKPIFVKLTDDEFFLFKVEFYKGYIEGYENNDYLNFDFKDDSDNKININKLFIEVYGKFDKLKFNLLEIPGLGFYCQKPQFQELGIEVGTFIKCWDIILNHSYLFEEIFDEHYNQQPADNEGKDIEVKENMHPNFDPNYWNKNCFELFKYFFDFYYKSSKRELTNIWFFLKYETSEKYILNISQVDYKEFILKNYDIKITNFVKTIGKWEDKVKPTLLEHRIDFEDSLK